MTVLMCVTWVRLTLFGLTCSIRARWVGKLGGLLVLWKESSTEAGAERSL